MGDSRPRSSRMMWLQLLSVTAFLTCGAALAQAAVTDYVVVQPIDVCSSGGTGCAPFNTLSSTGNPSAATVSTPIGFVDTATNTNITRAIWLQAGIDVTFLPIAQYNSPANTSNLYAATDYRTLHVSCGSTSCSSPDFLALSLGTPAFPTPKPPLAPAAANAINMFFVNTLAALPGTSGPFFGFAWLNGDGIAIAKNTFFPGVLGATPRFDTLAHEIGHDLSLDHFTFGAGVSTNCSTSYAGISDAGCNVMDAGNFPRVIPASSDDVKTFGALTELMSGSADQLFTTQQGQALLSGFMNPIPNVNAIAGGGGDLPFTVTFPSDGGGRSGEYIVALVLELPEGFQFGANLFTKTGGNAQVFGTPQQLNGNNGRGSSNCLKPASGTPSIECLEILFVPGSFTAGTSFLFTTDIVDKRTGQPATLSQLECTSPTNPLQCLDLTFVFSDLFATTSAFDQSGMANSQFPNATVQSTVVDPTEFANIANLGLTFTGFTQIPCTPPPALLEVTTFDPTSVCPPGMGGNPGVDGVPGGDDSGPVGTAELEEVNPVLGR